MKKILSIIDILIDFITDRVIIEIEREKSINDNSEFIPERKKTELIDIEELLEDIKSII